MSNFLEQYIEDDNGCWLWQGNVDTKGYGRLWDGATHRTVYAHRYFYVQLGFTIPAGLVLDHLCRVTRCVRPTHLEPVTIAENIRRGIGKSLKSKCANGHDYTPENVALDGRKRYCRLCKKVRNARYYRQRHMAVAA